MKNKPLPSPPPVAPATRAQVNAFLKGLQQYRTKDIHRDGPLDEVEVKKYDQAGVKDYLDKISAGTQQSIARRIMMDILKSPPSKRRDGPERKRKPPKKAKTSSKTKSERVSKKKRSPAKKKRETRRR